MLSNYWVWILEDDEGCQFVYRQTLGHRHQLKFFSSFSSFQEALDASTPDTAPAVVIADLMLSDGCLIRLLPEQELRRLYELPVIMVSSIDDVDMLRFCFDLGATDYLIKPFQKAELIAKLDRVLKRKAEA
ncbi:MAG: response regulator transcription factor, partial [Deltaproteobacteria bacterium]|nr:response regulator transcription factor [Deltaproteobacteria bacterium]